MPKFEQIDLDRLATCTPGLRRVFGFVIGHIAHRITEGHRGEAAQNEAFRAGRSKLRWPDGNHNKLPSEAVDAAVAPVSYDLDLLEPEARALLKSKGFAIRQKALTNFKRFFYFAGFVMGAAAALGVRLRWGGDWDSDNDFTDQTFNDLVHFEEKPNGK